MSYLHPPPGDAPVVVFKDVGGYVDQYDRQTAFYFQTNREVRLHECRSACTLALALPNVCVYPDSLLKFHKAYNPETRDANDPVSDAMMSSYPAAVRLRLGQLTRNYKVLTGSELIRLGIRDCNAPQQPRVMVARVKFKENPPEDPVSNAFGGLVAALTPPSSLSTAALVKVASVRSANLKPTVAETPPSIAAQAQRPPPPAPLQAQRPQPPGDAATAQTTAPSAQALAPMAPLPVQAPLPVEAAIPTPPPRPEGMLSKPAADTPAAPVSNWGRPIKGSAPILVSYRFSPFPYRLASQN